MKRLLIVDDETPSVDCSDDRSLRHQNFAHFRCASQHSTLHLQGIARSAALDIEERLATALAAAGLFVQGGH